MLQGKPLTGREGLRMSLGVLLRACAAAYGDRPFLTRAEDGETITYRQLNTLADRIAHGLAQAGIARGDYVGILLNNSIAYVACSYALKKLGAVEVAINTAMRGVALARMINLTHCQTIITAEAFITLLAGLDDELPYLNQLIMVDGVAAAKEKFADKRILAYDDIISDNETDATCETVRDDETAVILFTSGTTGVSKGCAIPHRCSVRAAESMIEAFALTEGDCVYSPYPLFHVGAAQYDVLPAMMVGGRAVIRDGFSLSHFWREVAHYRATWFMSLGSVQALLWAAEPVPEETQHCLRLFWGTPLPIDHVDFAQRFRVPVVHGGGYGSTDAGAVAMPMWDKHGGGRVLPRYQVAIVDEQDDPLPTGQTGELVVRPREPAIMASEYIGMPEQTLRAWRNLWFHTGDLAFLDADGDLHWVARCSERIRTRGEMVSAYEIEEVLLSHPHIADVAVVGVADETLGEERIKAFVVLRANKSLTLVALQDFCRPRMSRYMLPTALSVLTTMPRTPTGKPAKAHLQTE